MMAHKAVIYAPCLDLAGKTVLSRSAFAAGPNGTVPQAPVSEAARTLPKSVGGSNEGFGGLLGAKWRRVTRRDRLEGRTQMGACSHASGRLTVTSRSFTKPLPSE